ncbi:alpha/beta hydrolase [Streptomyces sp. NBC_01304]|uniref:alpha/beta hydrolase n=1 Tax=Streptomyces sp. NBC_01304 TaxID=2903818 RepID=UPI002E0F5D66|nr:esterase family protein [Streptomyces sp. NBC_01304]
MKRPSKTLIAALALGSALAMAGCSNQGDPVSFGGPTQQGKANPKSDSQVQLPSNPRNWETQRTLANGTTIGKTRLDGKKSGFSGDVWVWAPKQYFQDEYKDSAFPVLMALPGSNGFPTNYWMGGDLKLQENIQEMADSGKSLPFIVVMPVLNPNKDYYYDGSDIPNQPKMGTWISDDVPDLVRENFRTFKSRDGWGFFGSSSGGYVGMKTVLQHPEKFRAAIAGGPDTRPDSPLWKGHEKEKQANNPEKLAADLIKKGGPKVNLSIMMGTKESGQANIKKFMDKLNKGPIDMQLHWIKDGTHSGRLYAKALGDGPLEWLSKHMLAPTPSK